MSAATSPQLHRARGLAAAARLVLAVALPCAALAAHPLVTDDTATQGTGLVQLELTGLAAWERARGAHGGPKEVEESTEGAVVATLGLHEAVDIALALPLAATRMTVGGVRQGATAGLGDLGLELKWRVLEAGGFSLAVKPGLTLPTGDPASGLGTGRPCGALLLAATQQAGSLTLHLNVGYGLDRYALAEERLEHVRDVWLASLAAQRDLWPGLTLVGDLGVTTGDERASREPGLFALGGFILAMDPRVDLDVGLKAGWKGGDRTLALLAGLAARF
jgi:hypothetical protein